MVFLSHPFDIKTVAHSFTHINDTHYRNAKRRSVLIKSDESSRDHYPRPLRGSSGPQTASSAVCACVRVRVPMCHICNANWIESLAVCRDRTDANNNTRRCVPSFVPSRRHKHTLTRASIDHRSRRLRGRERTITPA